MFEMNAILIDAYIHDIVQLILKLLCLNVFLKLFVVSEHLRSILINLLSMFPLCMFSNFVLVIAI